ncbi:MAG: tetratricopeptide repeat protein [Desulfobacter sp.]|nr:MAG: tetratricopeptide repeat protein [Desulfobacter sp.]
MSDKEKINLGQERPKLIVMPFQPVSGQDMNGVGLGVHFLLGNLFCLHQGLLECWFGWRVKKIFPGSKDLTDYCHGNGPFKDIRELGKRQKVRFWMEGTYLCSKHTVFIEVRLHDTRDNICLGSEFSLAFDDGFSEFRHALFDWLDHCGVGFKGRRIALWPEHISVAGLDSLGSALNALYLNYVGDQDRPIDLTFFDKARALCPESYLVQDLAGWGLYKNGCHDQAEEAFLNALALNPDGLGALSGMMWCAVEGKDRAKALEFACKKGKCRGDDPEKAKQFVDKKFA